MSKIDLEKLTLEYIDEIEKGNVDKINEIAFLLEREGNTTDARKWYKRAIEKGNVDAINNLAVSYETAGEYENAEKYYLQAIEKGYNTALENLAGLYNTMGKFDKSIECFLKVLEKNENDAETMNTLAVVYANNGNLAETEKWFKKAAELGNEDAKNNLEILREHKKSN